MQFSSFQIVVARLEDIPDKEVSRFFIGPGETIRLVDGEVAVSCEWNRVNIQNVLAQARKLGCAVEAISQT